MTGKKYKNKKEKCKMRMKGLWKSNFPIRHFLLDRAAGGLSQSYQDFLFRYFHPYTKQEQLQGPHYAEDGAEDELPFLPPVKRLGSELLGKRQT